MTQQRRAWIATFADEAVLSDLRAAALECMHQVCAHAPEDCDCVLNRFTPAEFVDWLELEVTRERGKPVQLEPAGRPSRREAALHIDPLRMAASS